MTLKEIIIEELKRYSIDELLVKNAPVSENSSIDVKQVSANQHLEHIASNIISKMNENRFAKVIWGEVFIYGADHLSPAAKVIDGEILIYSSRCLEPKFQINNSEIANALMMYNGNKVKITIEAVED